MHTHYEILRNTSGNFRHPFASLKLNALNRTFTNKANAHLNSKTLQPQFMSNQNFRNSIEKAFELDRRIRTQCSNNKYSSLLMVEPNKSYESLSKRNTKTEFYKQIKTKRYLRSVKTDERILQNVMKTHQHQIRTPLNLQIYSLQIKDSPDDKRKFLSNKQMFSPHSNYKYHQAQKERVRSIQKKIRSFNVAKPSLNFFNEHRKRLTEDLSIYKSKPGNIRINKLVLQRKNLQQSYEQQRTDLCPWEPQFQIDIHELHSEKMINPEKSCIKIKKRKKRK